MTPSLERVRDALSGRYRVERELGRGATATVYLAHDEAQERLVAVKVLHPELVEALGGQRFLREVRFAASLHHPNLVAIHDSGEVDGLYYYVAPYLEDGSLRARLDRERQLPIGDAVRIAQDVADALQHVHAHGIVHRDIKPENILFAGEHACVADFGIARAVDSATIDTLTSAGVVVGTPTYMSPEQGSGDKAVGARSDQYSLACVLYEMIAGVAPFIGATAQAVIAQRFSHQALPLSHYRPAVAPHIEAAVARALSLAPADRFPDMASFAAALGEAGSAAYSAAHTVAVGRNIRRRWFALGAATVLVILAVLGFREAYPKMYWTRGPGLDTTRFVVLPFDGSVRGTSGGTVADAIYAGLREWEDLALVEDAVVRDQIGRHRTGIPSLGEAVSIAASFDAGRLIWGQVLSTNGSTTVRARLYDVRTRRSLAQGSVTLAPDEPLAAEVPGLVDDLLRLPELRRSPASDLGTRSFRARRAYERGLLAYERGDFPGAWQRFAEAIELDLDFGRAHLAVALVGMLTGEPVESWRESARRAAASALPRPDAARAAGLAAIADARYSEACRAFDRVRATDSLDFAVWYGLGECRYLDAVVVPHAASPSGWVFRSSYHTAARAYLRAAQLDERAYDLPLYSRLRHILMVRSNRIRAGAPEGSALQYVAFPQWSGDTLAFVPYPLSNGTVPERASPPPGAQERALQQNVSVLLDFSRTWVTRRENQADALIAWADVLEARGEVTETDGRPSALGVVRRVRALTSAPVEHAELAVREIRLLVKGGAFDAARILADSLLARPGSLGDQSSLLQPVAALTGRVALAARLAGTSRFSAATQSDLPAPLARAAALLDARAAMGSCERLEEARSAVLAAVEAYLPADQWPAVKRELTDLPAMWATPCAVGWISLSPGSLEQAQRAFARGDRAAARRLLDSRERERGGMGAADISLDYTVQEVWLRAAMGDTAAAISHLDRVLQSLPTHRTTVLARMSEAAALPRALALRAELAAASGDIETARYWAAAVLTLWANADAELATPISTMRELARR